MCDYSLESLSSRPAKVGDKLVTTNFGTGTRGFADANASVPCGDPRSLTAICLLPGTELAFAKPIEVLVVDHVAKHATAIFRQRHNTSEKMHHDTIELPDGTQFLLTLLNDGQEATVLQLPAETEAKKTKIKDRHETEKAEPRSLAEIFA